MDMNKRWLLLPVLFLLTACASSGTPSQELALEVAGSVAGDVSSVSEQVSSTVNNSGLNWWQFGAVVLLAGWAIPSPTEMVRGLIGVFGGLGSFVLKLFGRLA